MDGQYLSVQCYEFYLHKYSSHNLFRHGLKSEYIKTSYVKNVKQYCVGVWNYCTVQNKTLNPNINYEFPQRFTLNCTVKGPINCVRAVAAP